MVWWLEFFKCNLKIDCYDIVIKVEPFGLNIYSDLVSDLDDKQRSLTQV